MALDRDNLPAELETWLANNGLATLATIQKDGAPHVTMVGANWDPEARMLRIISSDGAQKVVNLQRDPRCSVTFGLGGVWASFEGTAEVTSDPERVATAVEHYERRFRPVSENPKRVAIEVSVNRVLGRWG